MDHGRDLLHMINHFRDQMPRPLIGIGHSMGGNHMYVEIFYFLFALVFCAATDLRLEQPTKQ